VRTCLLVPLLVVGACSWNAAGSTGCEPVGGAVRLPEALRESSGVAFSRVRDSVLFSHNDGGHEATIYALDLHGTLLAELPLAGVRNRDWEDIATGECGAGACIYLADIGDNAVGRDQIVLYRIPDTGVLDGKPVQAEAFPMVLPDGPRDMESLFVLPGEEVYFVSKGRSHAVSLYRYPPPLRPDEVVTLEWVQDFTDGRLSIPRQITGADASFDGSVVAIRSYAALTFFQWEGNNLVPLEGGGVELRTLNEVQGEGVGLGPGGEVVLVSEGVRSADAALRVLNCTVVLGG